MATNDLALEFGRTPSKENKIFDIKEDEKPLICVAISPGMVKRMFTAIEKLTSEDNETFSDFNGKPIAYWTVVISSIPASQK